MKKAKTEIVIYQNDFRNRTKADDKNMDLFCEELTPFCKAINETYWEELRDPSEVLRIVFLAKALAADLRARCACTLSADRSEIKIEIITRKFSLTANQTEALRVLCENPIGFQISFVDGDTVVTARYANALLAPDDDRSDA